MTDTLTGTRGVYAKDVEVSLPYKVYDADHHYYPPDDAETRHLDPKYHERVFGEAKAHKTIVDVVGDEHKAKTLGEHPVGEHGGINPLDIPEMNGDVPVPGAMLNKLNPMKGLDAAGIEKLVEKYREMEPAFQNRELRLALMDAQGVHAAVVHGGTRMYARPFKKGDVEAGYAAAKAWNQWIEDDWGFSYKDRLFVPAYIPLLEVEPAVQELERCIAAGARMVGVETGPAFGNRSFADTYFDPFWARVNEAKLPIAIHLGNHYGHRGVEWGEDPNTPYKDFNSFQWLMYWSDFPIMETVTALIFHELLVRFPDINVLIAEHGTPWVPYLVRKMDHAHMLGRRPKSGGRLPMRPSEMFKTRFVVAPFPEENVQRAIDVVGTDCLVFGSDFPHSEGIPDPLQYVTQLKGQPEDVVQKIMRDNLARFLNLKV